jgi:hypothetical protein
VAILPRTRRLAPRPSIKIASGKRWHATQIIRLRDRLGL